MTTPAVLSVEKFSISMPGATVSTPALSLGQVIANCVPFITVTSDTDGNDVQLIDVVQNSGTNKFDFASGAATGTRTLEIAIVEFDPAEVSVEEVSFTLGSGLSVNVTVTAIVEANTFPVIYGITTDTLDDFQDVLYRATFTSTTVLQIIKAHHQSDITGHAYILEALNGAWTVETGASIPINFGSGDTTKNSAITVTAALTGCWSYWDNSAFDDDVRDAIWDAAITDATNLDVTRGNGSATVEFGDIEVFVVNFSVDVAVVQQGEFNYLTSATKTAAINAPGTLANAMVVATSNLGWCECSATGSSSRSTCQGRMSFNSATEVLGTRSGVGSGNYRQNFQIIEWLIADVGGAAAEPIIIHIGF